MPSRRRKIERRVGAAEAQGEVRDHGPSAIDHPQPSNHGELQRRCQDIALADRRRSASRPCCQTSPMLACFQALVGTKAGMLVGQVDAGFGAQPEAARHLGDLVDAERGGISRRRRRRSSSSIAPSTPSRPVAAPLPAVEAMVAQVHEPRAIDPRDPGRSRRPRAPPVRSTILKVDPGAYWPVTALSFRGL